MKRGEHRIKNLCITNVNKSHATSYSLLSCITAYLKYYYPKEFFTSVMSLMNDQERKKKFPSYIKLLENEFDIKIVPPNINESKAYFSPSKDRNEILYGLVSIKGLGAKLIDNGTIDDIINNRPYISMNDFFDKFDKTTLDKRKGEALIQAGVFDNLYPTPNRNQLLNQFYDIRQQKCERLDELSYDKQTCIEYELAKLELALTYKPWIEEIPFGDVLEFECEITRVTEKIDKNGRLMAFVSAIANNCNIEIIVFASQYKKHLDVFDVINYAGNKIYIKGKKEKENKVLLTKGKIVA